MRKLIALVFNHSLDGLLADQGTEFWDFCFELQGDGDREEEQQSLDFLENAYAHVLGRASYETMAVAVPANLDNPWAAVLHRGRKVVFSRTLRTADWANTTIAAGDTAEEVGKLTRGGDGHVVVWGGVSLWRSLMWLDLIDEWHLHLYPYVSGEGTRLFTEVPKSYRLDLMSSTARSSGILELRYRRNR